MCEPIGSVGHILYYPPGLEYNKQTGKWHHKLLSGHKYIVKPVSPMFSNQQNMYRVAEIRSEKWLQDPDSELPTRQRSRILYLLAIWEANLMTIEQYKFALQTPDSVLDSFRHQIVMTNFGVIIFWFEQWEIATNFSDDAMKKQYFIDNGHVQNYIDAQISTFAVAFQEMNDHCSLKIEEMKVQKKTRNANGPKSK